MGEMTQLLRRARMLNALSMSEEEEQLDVLIE